MWDCAITQEDEIWSALRIMHFFLTSLSTDHWIGWLIDWLLAWMLDWLIDCLIECLIDWLIDCHVLILSFLFQRFCFVLFANRESADALLSKGTVTVNGTPLNVLPKKRPERPAYNNYYGNPRWTPNSSIPPFWLDRHPFSALILLTGKKKI